MPFPTLQQIIVNSMHRYQPRLHIVESQDAKNLNWDNFHTFIFPGTQFTTVTAYQNDKVEAKADHGAEISFCILSAHCMYSKNRITIIV